MHKFAEHYAVEFLRHSGAGALWVVPESSGQWCVKAPRIATSLFDHCTQDMAIKVARRVLERGGGGELVVQGLSGKIRQKDTIKPGHDPRSIWG